MTTVTEEVLRIIGTNKAWTRNYSVALALTRNAIVLLPVPPSPPSTCTRPSGASANLHRRVNRSSRPRT